MKTRKRILFIIPNLGGGGAERILLNLLNLIDYTKFEIDLFIGLKGGILEKELPSNVNVEYLFPNIYSRKLTSLLFSKFDNKWLFKLFGKRIIKNYDVGISFLDSIYSEFLFYSKGNIKKKVAVLHSSYLSYSNEIISTNDKTISRFKKRYSNVDTIVSVSNDALNEFKLLFGEYKDMRVIYNPVNVKDIVLKAKSEEIIDIKRDKINLIAVGSHIPVKGYDKLIQACHKIKNEGIDFNLNILGTGYLEEKHQIMINELGLSESVTLVGFVKNPYKWVIESDIFIMTSEAEGLPTALCEAMILGKPTLVTDVPGCREVVENGKFGLMVDNNFESIANGLKKLIFSKKDREHYKELSLLRAKIFNDEIALQEYYKIFNQ